MTDQATRDPHRDAVTELLGVLAYAELTGCLRTAADAQRAPDTEGQVVLARVSAVEFGHYEKLAARLVDLGQDPHAAMAPFAAAVDGFHERTMPGDWLEGLVKAYVGDGIARHFYREVGSRLDEETRALVDRVLQDEGQGDFVVSTVRQAVQDDPTVAGRLALWARRLVGEAIAQAQYVAVERDALAGLIVGGQSGTGWDLSELGRLFTRVTQAHDERMRRLGLSV